MGKVLRVLCGVLAAAGLAPGAQAAPPPFRSLGAAYYPVQSDGARFAFYLTAPSDWENPVPVRVLDMLRHTSYDLALAPRCTPPVIGGGQILQSCPVQAGYGDSRRPDQPVVVDLESRRVRRPDVSHVPPPAGTQPQVYFWGVGRRWLAGARSAYHSSQPIYLELATSRVVYGVPNGRHQAVDLDRHSLVRRLCHPLTRRLNRGYDASMQTSPLDADRWLSYGFEPPLGMTQQPDFDGWALDRCGTRRSVTICRALCPSPPQLGGGIVTWYEVDRAGRWSIHAYEPARRRRWRWGPFRADGRARSVSHAGRWVFLTVGPPPDGPLTDDVFVAHLPRA
jgi:hypothetical protein